MRDDVMDQRSAWRAYRKWFEDERVEFQTEPESPEFERLFKALTMKPRPSLAPGTTLLAGTS